MPSWRLTFFFIFHNTLQASVSLMLYQRGFLEEAEQYRCQRHWRVTLFMVFVLTLFILALQNTSVLLALNLILLTTLITLIGCHLYLSRRFQRRLAQLALELPLLLEGLLLSTEAGLSLQQGLERLAQRTHPQHLLKRELMIMTQQLRSGLTLDVVFNTLLERNPHPALERLVILLLSQYRFGHGLSPALTQEIQQLYGDEQHRVKTLSATLNLKLLMPLLGCFLPSLMIVLSTPSLLHLAVLLK